jgi:hypothetical protein
MTGAEPEPVTEFRLAYRIHGCETTRAAALEHLSQRGTRTVSVVASGSGTMSWAWVSSYLSGTLKTECGHRDLDSPSGARLMAIALNEAASLHEQAAAARSGRRERPGLLVTVSIDRKEIES